MFSVYFYHFLGNINGIRTISYNRVNEILSYITLNSGIMLLLHNRVVVNENQHNTCVDYIILLLTLFSIQILCKKKGGNRKTR